MSVLLIRWRNKRKLWIVLFLMLFFYISWSRGGDLYPREISYSQFYYPLEVADADFVRIVTEFREKNVHALRPINEYYSRITFSVSSASSEECQGQLDFLILVKSAPQNFQHRDAIRQTWKKSVPGISTKTVFFIGNTDNDSHHSDLVEEQSRNKDIVRIHYDDDYYSVTVKTVIKLRYAAEVCSNFKYAVLADDDYYYSVRNLNEFTKDWELQPKLDHRLYAGMTFSFPNRPLRCRVCSKKYYITLEEYPFDQFPPYVKGGGVLLSKSALLDIYYATFFVAPFRFEDVYVGICAKKMGILTTHSDRFTLYMETEPRKGLIAAHDYMPKELLAYWKLQEEAGYL